MSNIKLDEVVGVITAYVAKTRGPATVRPDSKLMSEGLVDSFGLVELITELEKKFSMKLGDGTLIPEDFETPQVLFDRLQEVA